MAWIEFHAARIKRLQKFHDFRTEMGWSVNEALGLLGNLWGEVIEIREDGDVSGLRPEYIADLCSVPSRSAVKLRAALVSQGWITRIEGREMLHDWLDHAGRYLERRYYTADPGRLVAIWAKHGQQYVINETQRKLMEKKGPKQKIVERLSKDDPPTIPDLPDRTTPDLQVQGSGKGQVRIDANQNERPAGICDFKYPPPDGTKCTAPRESGSPFCRAHIEWFRNKKADRPEPRGGGLRPAPFGAALNKMGAHRA